MNAIFDEETASYFINRINTLEKNTKPKWGKMSCAQMFAHCAGAFEEGTTKLNLFYKSKIRFTRRAIIIENKPYPRNMKNVKEVYFFRRKRFLY